MSILYEWYVEQKVTPKKDIKRYADWVRQRPSTFVNKLFWPLDSIIDY